MKQSFLHQLHTTPCTAVNFYGTFLAHYLTQMMTIFFDDLLKKNEGK